MNANDTAKSDNPTTIVLVPGLLSDAYAWSGVMEPLSRLHPTVVADLSTQESIGQMAADTLAAHPGRLFVAGHSMGARVALEMARQAPERVERLALLDTGVHPRREGEEIGRQRRVDLANHEGMRALADDWLPGMVHPDRLGDEELMGALTAMVERMTPQLHARQIAALLGRPDARRYLADIRCPTLLVVGRQDAWSPVEQHEEMLAELPDAQLVIIENAGHFAPVERPEATAEALEAWAR